MHVNTTQRHATQYNTDPTIRQHGFDLSHQMWCALNCFQTGLLCSKPTQVLVVHNLKEHIYFNSLIWTSFCDCLCHLPCGFLLHRPLQIVYNVMLYKWGLASSDKCGCGMVHTMSHAVDKCPVSKLHDAGLQRLTTLQLTG